MTQKFGGSHNPAMSGDLGSPNTAVKSKGGQFTRLIKGSWPRRKYATLDNEQAGEDVTDYRKGRSIEVLPGHDEELDLRQKTDFVNPPPNVRKDMEDGKGAETSGLVPKHRFHSQYSKLEFRQQFTNQIGITPTDDHTHLGRKKKTKKRKKLRKRVKKATWRSMKTGWKYFKEGLIIVSNNTMGALGFPNLVFSSTDKRARHQGWI